MKTGVAEMAESRVEIDTGTSELLCETHDRVAIITLNRPEARNALSDHLTPALRRMIKQCGDDPCRRCTADHGRADGLFRGRVKSRGWAAIPSRLKHRSTSASP